MASRNHCSIDKVGHHYYATLTEVSPSEGPVTWETDDHSDFIVWFPPDRCPLGGGNSFTSTGGILTSNLREDADKGGYEYTIHCRGNGRLARGGSPPTMIVL